MEISIIGFSQIEETTLFRALTRDRIESASHESGRQEVHAAIACMGDARPNFLADIRKPENVTSVEVKYWDVPAGTGDAREEQESMART